MKTLHHGSEHKGEIRAGMMAPCKSRFSLAPKGIVSVGSATLRATERNQVVQPSKHNITPDKENPLDAEPVTIRDHLCLLFCHSGLLCDKVNTAAMFHETVQSLNNREHAEIVLDALSKQLAKINKVYADFEAKVRKDAV